MNDDQLFDWLAPWTVSHCFDPRARAIADRHYNRQKPGTPRFVPPGHCVVLLSQCLRAVWVTLWQRYSSHAWEGAWNNCLFRNEGAGLSSDLILKALRFSTTQLPWAGCITFVDPRHVRGTVVRGERIYGYCYKKAGFEHVDITGKGLWVWHRAVAP